MIKFYTDVGRHMGIHSKFNKISKTVSCPGKKSSELVAIYMCCIMIDQLNLKNCLILSDSAGDIKCIIEYINFKRPIRLKESYEVINIISILANKCDISFQYVPNNDHMIPPKACIKYYYSGYCNNCNKKCKNEDWIGNYYADKLTKKSKNIVNIDCIGKNISCPIDLEPISKMVLKLSRNQLVYYENIVYKFRKKNKKKLGFSGKHDLINYILSLDFDKEYTPITRDILYIEHFGDDNIRNTSNNTLVIDHEPMIFEKSIDDHIFQNLSDFIIDSRINSIKEYF